MAVCDVCFRHCDINEGGRGFCGARTCEGGKVVSANYGRVSSVALDPIEKKPLRRFCPGSLVLSVGSVGCNLRCPFCQNAEISWLKSALSMMDKLDLVSPEEIADAASRYRDEGNIGVAFTYNEPLIGYEFVRDTAKIVHERGMKNVLVTNGTAGLNVLSELAPYIDAMNIDLKGFTAHYYNDMLGGDFEMVKDFIREAVKISHVELTTLIIPGENDTDEEMEELSGWVAGLDCSGREDDGPDGSGRSGAEIPLHVTRFFPCFHMTDRDATDVALIKHLADVARKKLKYVYTGNI